jgi:predicted PurR-regulated permease PerM
MFGKRQNNMTRALLCFGVVSGLIFCAVCTYYSLLDWRELQRAYAAFAASQNADLKTVFVAEARQNIHRINLFADVVWALLSAILAVISAVGLAILNRLDKKK